MPNHFHIILYQNIHSVSLNKLLANGKRFMAYEIVDRLKMMGNDRMLKFLEISVSPNEKIKKKKHQVFIPSFDAKICDSIEMIERVLDYIHYNPVSGKWNLTDSYLDYPHSSAKWYDEGIKIESRWFKDYREILGL